MAACRSDTWPNVFYSPPSAYDNYPALRENGCELTYAQLRESVAQYQINLKEGDLVFLYAGNDSLSVIAYLACLSFKAPVALLDPKLDEEKRQGLERLYQPNLIIVDGKAERQHEEQHNIDARLALMLPTSGSTGSPKLVGLSVNNLQTNAESICQYLPICHSHVTLANLPLFYSYGLSVLNTHLLTGACCYLTSVSPMEKAFWQVLEEQRITSLAGVPYTYSMLSKLRFTRKALPHLAYFTQAGGKLDTSLVEEFANYAEANGKQFYVMYGQTEASARMAYLAPEKASRKPDAIGQTVPGGEFALQIGQTVCRSPNLQGEILYRGKNVMLGYAENQDDLRCFSDIEWLHTGDLGYVDEQGDWFVTGRAKRFIKLFGERVNLDEVELWLRQQGFEVACIGEDNALTVAIAGPDNPDVYDGLTKRIADFLAVNHSVIRVIFVNALPMTANGKLDYPTLTKLAGESIG